MKQHENITWCLTWNIRRWVHNKYIYTYIRAIKAFNCIAVKLWKFILNKIYALFIRKESIS